MPHKKIRAAIKEHAPAVFHKSKKKFGFKYPKICLLGLSILLAYFLFSNDAVSSWTSGLGEINIYFGVFIAGVFLTFGFSAPFAVGFFVSIASKNIFALSLLGGLGAMIGEMIIFSTIKYSFQDEFGRLKKTKVLRKIGRIVRDNPHVLIKHYLLYILAGIVIAAPLPDEIGVSMLAGLTTVKIKVLAIAGFILHTLAILLILRFF